MTSSAPVPWRLRDLSRMWRSFLTAFLITMTVGYMTGIYFVDHTTDGSPRGMTEQYLGNEQLPVEEVEELKYPKDTLEMLNIIHAHVTSFALIYLSVGGIFLLTGFDPRLKVLLAVEPFVATIILFGAMAALRYFGDGGSGFYAWVMVVAGLSTFVCFLAMVVLSLWEMWRSGDRFRWTE